VELDAGDAAAAAGCFERAGQLDSTAWFPQFQRALALERAGQPQEAVEAYRAVLARNDRVGEAHNNLAWLLADLDLDVAAAAVHARRAAGLLPDNANALGTLGWALYKNRQLEEAAAALEDARTRAPQDAMKRYLLGTVLAARGQAEEARFELGEALRLDPAFPRAAAAREALERLRP
jgi:tetratricopeptide (TPR) repeat protein